MAEKVETLEKLELLAVIVFGIDRSRKTLRQGRINGGPTTAPAAATILA
jgi:hypothetical protein